MHQNFRVPQFDYSIMILYDCTVQQYCLQCVMQALWSASPDVMHRHCRVHQLPRIERRTSAVGRGFFSCEHQTDFMSYFQNIGLSRRKFSIDRHYITDTKKCAIPGKSVKKLIKERRLWAAGWLKVRRSRQACSPLIQLFFGFGSEWETRVISLWAGGLEK